MPGKQRISRGDRQLNRRREQLQTRVNQLQRIPHRTAQQEAELATLLKKLENITPKMW